MFKHYFITAIRNIRRNKVFSLINILGLALGIASSFLIFLWVRQEYSIDNTHQNRDRLFLVYLRQYIDGKPVATYNTPGLLARELKRKIPQIRYAANVSWLKDTPDRLAFEANHKNISFEGCYADTDFFKMLTYPFVEGTAATALSTPASLCISQKMASAFFGSAANAMGKTIRYENKKDLVITGVFADLPENVSARFDFMMNWSTFLADYPHYAAWGNSGTNTLIQLQAGANPTVVRTHIRDFLNNYVKGQTSSYHLQLDMQRFGDSYLHSSFRNGEISGGRIEYVRLLTWIAVFILLIACINFMTLTTARAAGRSKEIGVRKIAGAPRYTLVGQFLGEALVTTAIAVMMALVIISVLMPTFDNLTGKQLQIPFTSLYFWGFILLLTMTTGLIAGSYPALLLSSFRPMEVLKGRLKSSGNAPLFRKGLVVFQFVLSIVLIIGTIVVSRQLNYMLHTDLGYRKENLVYLPIEGNLGKHFRLFKQEALNAGGIQAISRITELPTAIESYTGGVQWEGKDPNSAPFFTIAGIGYDFVKTMGLKLAEGRDVSYDLASDSAGYLINESALKVIGYQDPVGKSLTVWGKKGTIVGVLKDFHFASLRDPIKPLVIHTDTAHVYGNVLIRIKAGQTREALDKLKKIWGQFNPAFPFAYSFADEQYRKLYEGETVVGTMSHYFAFLAIFISCLGLLGLSIFTTQQRTKEIGIRKVLGAGTASLSALLMKESVMMVCLAFIIGSPLAWWATGAWLDTFAYRKPPAFWIFGLAGLLTLSIAGVATGFLSIKAALTNPVDSLRTE